MTARGLAHISDVAYLSKDKVIAEMQRLGATNVKFVHVGDSQGVVASTGDRIIVAFPGSDEKSDWRSDLNFARKPKFGAEVHGGFVNAYEDVWPEMEAEIKRLVAEKDRPILFTGHSMGGALASMAALDLKQQSIGTIHSVYTFGCPPIGNQAFATKYDRAVPTTYRVVNQSDDVPAMEAPGYEHAGKHIWLNGEGADNNSGWFGRLWHRVGRPIGSGVEDHRIANYEKSLKDL